MRIRNSTGIPVEQLFWTIVNGARLDTKGLRVRLIWMREPSESPYSGNYQSIEGLINVRINKRLQYPYPIQIATGEWFENTDGSFFQIYRKVVVERPEQICAFVFAHELSHFKDNVEGRNMRYRQTKADCFSYDLCKSLGILKE